MSSLRTAIGTLDRAAIVARRQGDAAEQVLDRLLRHLSAHEFGDVAADAAVSRAMHRLGTDVARELSGAFGDVITVIESEATRLRIARTSEHDAAGGAVVRPPRGFDRVEAGGYEHHRGHGFTLPGERDAWLDDIAAILEPAVATLPAEPFVLDVGCGTGKFTRLVRDVLRDRFGRVPHMHGVDASPDMLDVARELDDGGARYWQSDALDLTVPVTYDLVTSCQVLDSFEDPAAVLSQWSQRALRPGARLLTVLAFSRPEGWAQVRTPEELDRMPLARVTSTEPLTEAVVRAGFVDVSTRFMPTASPLYGGAAEGTAGPVGSRYATMATAPAD